MEEIPLIPVDSTSIKAIGYDVINGILRVRFVNDNVYDYLEVLPDVFDEFMNSPSKGTYLNTKIKDAYRFEKVD